MPGPLLHLGATVLCTHGAQAAPSVANTRVLVSGQPTVSITTPYLITGCPFNISGAPSPCVSGQWLVAATRVFSLGQPLVLMDSQSICAPNGTPMLPTVAQTRVTGS